MHQDHIPDIGRIALAFNLRCLMDRSPSLSSTAAIAIRMNVDVQAIDAIFTLADTARELIQGIAASFGVTVEDLKRPVPPYTDECDPGSVKLQMTHQVPAEHMEAVQHASAMPITHPVERVLGSRRPRS